MAKEVLGTIWFNLNDEKIWKFPDDITEEEIYKEVKEWAENNVKVYFQELIDDCFTDSPEHHIKITFE